jgi:hypothetical protein
MLVPLDDLARGHALIGKPLNDHLAADEGLEVGVAVASAAVYRERSA